MAYNRVIPRDLFNEANLLKCFGKLYLCLEILDLPGISLEHGGDAFDVDQNQASGNLYLRNVRLVVRGRYMTIERPLNSRGAWPLYLTTDDDDEISVFDDNGDLSKDMVSYLMGN